MRIRHFRTESFRLAAIYVALFVGSMAVLSTITYFIVTSAFEANLLQGADDDLLAIRSAYTEELARRPQKAVHEAQEMIDDRLLARDSGDVFLLERGTTRLSGNIAGMAPRAGILRFPNPLAPAGDGAAHVILGRGEFLAPGLYTFVGRDLSAANKAEDAVLQAFGWMMAVSVVIAMAGGFFLSHSFLKRIDAITKTCRAIMTGHLGDRVPVHGARNELDRLAMTINDMLDRIGILMESLRQVSNDIAHDLRTPLAHLRYRLERARNDAKTTDSYAAAVDGAIADADALLSLFAALLRIAQIEAGARRAGIEDVDLNALLTRAADLYRPALDDGAHPFEVVPAATGIVRGDPQLLLQLIANLLDNAVRHTPPGTRISLSTAMQDGRPALVVADRGPGIAEDDREKVFRRFYRCEPSRTTPGSGLGLTLARAIVELHEAEIELLDNAPGLKAVVTFPAVAEATQHRSRPPLATAAKVGTL
ncbi:MAG TPA: ATP-binding protein [Rhizomicrobium sp.]|nr:ATP-binding protein [Rhizomicrobium sp.]